MSDEKRTIFGKSYDVYGSTSANLILQTKGDVKIRWGNKYIDLIKSGKIAGADTEFIFNVNSTDEFKDEGVYIVNGTNDSGEATQSVYVYKDGVSVMLASDSDGFISYKTEQELTGEEQTLALTNAGFYFQTLALAKAAGLTNGMVYIVEEGKLYKVVDGEFIDYFSTAFTSANEALEEEKTKEEEENPTTTLTLGGLFLDGDNLIVNGDGGLTISVNDIKYITFEYSKVNVHAPLVVDANYSIQSKGALSGEAGVGNGYLLYIRNGESYLEVDNIIERNAEDNDNANYYTPSEYIPYYGTPVSNLIAKAEWTTPSTTDDSGNITVGDPTSLEISTKYANDFKKDDVIVLYMGTANYYTAGVTESMDSEAAANSWIFVIQMEDPVVTDTVFNVGIALEGNYESEADYPIVKKTVTVPAGNIYGFSEEFIAENGVMTESLSAEYVSGDSNIYEKGNEVGMAKPSIMYGVVTNEGNPMTVSVPSNTSASNGILDSLKYSPVFKVGEPTQTYNILRYDKNEIYLEDSTSKSDTVGIDVKTRTKIGNLATVSKPTCDGSESTEYFEDYGLYSDNAILIDPKLYRSVFYGICSDDYPQYDGSLIIPTESPDDEQYDNVVPNIAWVKNIIAANTLELNDLTISEVEPDIAAYLETTAIQNLASQTKAGTVATYCGYNGQITIDKTGTDTIYSGFVRTILKDGSYSYRTINATYTSAGAWEAVASYVLEDKVNPGYYKAKTSTNNVPNNPVYVGTTYEGFSVDEEYQYLYYTNDGEVWTLISQYIEPKSDRIYIGTTQTATYLQSDGTYVAWPAGYVCYHNGTTTVENGYGMTTFIDGHDSSVVPDLSKMPTLTASAAAGYVPDNASYKHIWSIDATADRTVLANWKKEQTFSSNSSLVTTVQGDWGNLSTHTAARWVKYNTSTNEVTSLLYPTTTNRTEYWKAIMGTLDNWQDETWRKYFLRTALSAALRENKHRYNEAIGFTFAYDGFIQCTGFAGYWTGRLGTYKVPTSDDPTDIHYTPVSTFDYLQGEVCCYGYKISFYFTGLEIGKRMEGVGQAPESNRVGGSLAYSEFYDVGDCSDFIINFTDMKSGTTTVIKKEEATT